jgi:hypothetical protein
LDEQVSRDEAFAILRLLWFFGRPVAGQAQPGEANQHQRRGGGLRGGCGAAASHSPLVPSDEETAIEMMLSGGMMLVL